jgi:hypothetical protein
MQYIYYLRGKTTTIAQLSFQGGITTKKTRSIILAWINAGLLPENIRDKVMGHGSDRRAINIHVGDQESGNNPTYKYPLDEKRTLDTQPPKSLINNNEKNDIYIGQELADKSTIIESVSSLDRTLDTSLDTQPPKSLNNNAKILPLEVLYYTPLTTPTPLDREIEINLSLGIDDETEDLVMSLDEDSVIDNYQDIGSENSEDISSEKEIMKSESESLPEIQNTISFNPVKGVGVVPELRSGEYKTETKVSGNESYQSNFNSNEGGTINHSEQVLALLNQIGTPKLVAKEKVEMTLPFLMMPFEEDYNYIVAHYPNAEVCARAEFDIERRRLWTEAVKKPGAIISIKAGFKVLLSYCLHYGLIKPNGFRTEKSRWITDMRNWLKGELWIPEKLTAQYKKPLPTADISGTVKKYLTVEEKPRLSATRGTVDGTAPYTGYETEEDEEESPYQRQRNMSM